MLYIYIALFIVVLSGLRKSEGLATALSRPTSNTIKGIFIWIVFLSHIKGYASISDIPQIDLYIIQTLNVFGQLMVVMFLYYSGYGIYESIKREDYVHTMPKRRLLSTWINYVVAVLVYVVADYLLGVEIGGLKTLVGAMIAWESIGQSNWYIFGILVCYITTYLSCKVTKNRTYVLLLNSSLLVVYAILISTFKDAWWYNTVIAYVLGGCTSVYYERLNIFIKNNRSGLFALFAFSIIGIPACILYGDMVYMHNVLVTLYIIATITLLCFVTVKSRTLEWCGKNLFNIYIYQRLPMLCISVLAPAFVRSSFDLYCIASFVITLIISWIVPNIKFK